MTSRSPGDIGLLYPFLYGDPDDATAERVAAGLEHSTTAKINEAAALRARVLRDEASLLADCAQAMIDRFAVGGRLLVAGNGGSSSDSSATAALFVRPPDGRSLPCLSLTADPGVLTALANDVGFDVVFARQVAALSRPMDMLMVISTSGNSENLCRAVDEAARRDLTTIGLAGYDGGRMAQLRAIDFCFVVPSASVHRVQEVQTTLVHALWRLVQDHLGTGDRRAPTGKVGA